MQIETHYYKQLYFGYRLSLCVKTNLFLHEYSAQDESDSFWRM